MGWLLAQVTVAVALAAPTVAEAVRVTGKVVDEAGRPVWIASAGATVGRGTADQDGQVVIDGLPPGVELRFSVQERVSGAIEWPACPGPKPGEVQDLGEVALDIAMNTVRGTVLSPGLEPMPGA